MEVLFWTCLNTSTSILTGFVHFFPIFFPQIRTVPRLAYLGAMGVFTAGSAMMGRLRWEVALQSIQNAHGMVENFIHLLRDVTFEKTIFLIVGTFKNYLVWLCHVVSDWFSWGLRSTDHHRTLVRSAHFGQKKMGLHRDLVPLAINKTRIETPKDMAFIGKFTLW